MNRNKVDIARELLLTWMASSDGKRSYESIRRNCEYLDQAYGLGLEGHAIWEVFMPLLYTGVVDHVGRDCYAPTEPVAVERGGLYVYNSVFPQKKENHTAFTGIYRTRDKDDVRAMKMLSFNAASVLRNMPSVSEVVDGYPTSVEDLSHADYYHSRGKKGITKRICEGGMRYFCLPEKMYQRELPERSICPDAFNIAYNLSRSVNGETAGRYSKMNHILRMQSFALPIIIDRILFIESLLEGYFPTVKDGWKEYKGITPDAVKELNRILCKMIVYE